MQVIRGALLAFGLALVSWTCMAAWPERPVRLIVPYAAGGSTDTVARLVGARLSERLGQQFVLDNRTGAGTIIGTEIAARSAPDGYTLPDGRAHAEPQGSAPAGRLPARHRALPARARVPLRLPDQLLSEKAVPTLRTSPDLDMHYLVDDFTDPWTKPETILLLHGCAESSAVWYAWMPHLVRNYRVVRPDMRGFGASTPMHRDFPWTLDTIIDDYCRLMDALGIERFHLAAAKIGGTIARAFAARRPERVATLTVIGTPQALRPGAERIPELIEEFDRKGAAHWVRRTMDGRLGGGFPPEGVQWWTDFMSRTETSTLVGFNRHINYADIRPDLPKIACPTLVITTEESGLGSVERTRAWQQMIPDSTLLVLPGNSYHVAATHPDDCARATLDFIATNRAAKTTRAA